MHKNSCRLTRSQTKHVKTDAAKVSVDSNNKENKSFGYSE